MLDRSGSLKKNTRQECRCRAEQPLDSPDLDSLPIQNRIRAKDKAHQYRGYRAGDPCQESHHGQCRQSDALFDPVKLQVSCKLEISAP
jgi:hypothetical protein